MSRNVGIHGTEVSYEDIMVIVEELHLRTDDAVEKFARFIEDHSNGGPRPSTPIKDGIPVWLLHPISLHDKLSRWLAQHNPMLANGSVDPGSSSIAVLRDSLTRLGQHLGRMSKQYMTLVHRTTLSSPPSEADSATGYNVNLRYSKSEQALGVRRRRTTTGRTGTGSVGDEYACLYEGDVHTWGNEELKRRHRATITDGLTQIQKELGYLKDLTVKLQNEVHDHQESIDNVDHSVNQVSVVTTKVNSMLRIMVRTRQEWIPMGATMGGVGIGLLAGSPGGLVGVTLGAIIGGLSVGSAATFLLEPHMIDVDEPVDVAIHPGTQNGL